MARRPVSHADPDAPTRLERVLRRTCIAAVFLALWPGVFAVPLQFVNAREVALAQQIDAGGATPQRVLEVRQKVNGARGWSVTEQVATYETEGGTATVRLRGYDQSAVVARKEGWLVAADRADTLEVYVTGDGRTGFLADDYRDALHGEFDAVYSAANIWIGGWALAGLGAVTGRSLRRARRRQMPVHRALVAPATYCAVAAALVAIGYAASFPLGG